VIPTVPRKESRPRSSLPNSPTQNSPILLSLVLALFFFFASPVSFQRRERFRFLFRAAFIFPLFTPLFFSANANLNQHYKSSRQRSFPLMRSCPSSRFGCLWLVFLMPFNFLAPWYTAATLREPPFLRVFQQCNVAHGSGTYPGGFFTFLVKYCLETFSWRFLPFLQPQDSSPFF